MEIKIQTSDFDFDNAKFYSVSGWYRKLFDMEKAVLPKNQFCTEKAVLTTNSILLQYRSYRV